MADNTNPKQNNNTNTNDNIPLSEDLLFNYISGLTGGSTPQSPKDQSQNQSTQQKPPKKSQQTISNNPSSNQKVQNIQNPPKQDDTVEIEKIKAQLQQEIQKKNSSFASNKTNAKAPANGTISTQPPSVRQPQNQPRHNQVQPQTNLSTNATSLQSQQVSVKPPTPSSRPTTQPPAPTQPTFTNTPNSQIVNTIPAKELSMPALLEEVIRRNASDLHLAVGYPPLVRIDGALIAYGSQPLTPAQIEKLIYSILSPEKRDILEVNKEVDFGYGYKDLGRFRVNAYHSKGHLAAALRLIPNRIRTIEELHLPKMYHQLSDLEQGFVLVTGPTGHGKSTTLAAIIQEINLKYPKHILTIEDPIEYVFPPAKALVTQRELGEDTNSWKIALRSALREDPDVVLIGEMRDYETIDAAINIAETGHLVFSTLHTNSASQTIDRIISVFPAEQQNKVRSQLAEVIKVIISQRLIPLKSGGRIPVSEVMIINNAIKNLIREGKIYQIDNVIRTAAEEGMISLERSLVELVRQKLITLEEARKYAWNPDEVNRLISMAY